MGGEVFPALFQNSKESALILEKNGLTRFIYGLNFSFKMLFYVYLGKKSPKFFPAGSFFLVLQIKCLSKCPYFKVPPLLWKISDYVPEDHLLIVLMKLKLGLFNGDISIRCGMKTQLTSKIYRYYLPLLAFFNVCQKEILLKKSTSMFYKF